MSRSGYNEDYDNQWGLICWRGMVASASRGKRGQQFFRDLVAALDAMPEHKLVKGDLETSSGAVCALGALGKAKGVNLHEVDTYDYPTLGGIFNIAECLAQETMYENDEADWRGDETDEHRWERMRKWAEYSLIEWNKA